MSWRSIGGVIVFIAILSIIACQSDENLDFKRYYSSGALVYQQHCQNCHGDNGEGLSALIPPLSDSSYLRKNLGSLSCYIKGKTFEDAMPANDLSPIEIAEVLTYIGNSFGNKLNTIDEQSVQNNLTSCK